MDFSLFDEASRDYEQEALTRRTAMVRTAVAQDVMPFLAMAASTEEYMHRRALAHNSLMHIATSHGASLAETVAVADRMYGLLTEARQKPQDGLTFVANAMACGNCGHQSTDHTEGLRCQCGCTSFVADPSEEEPQQKAAMRREAGEGSGPFS